VFFPERDEVGPIISQTLKKDTIRTHEEALIEIYRRLAQTTDQVELKALRTELRDRFGPVPRGEHALEALQFQGLLLDAGRCEEFPRLGSVRRVADEELPVSMGVTGTVFREGLMLVAGVGGPLFLAMLVAGLAIGVLQAATQVPGCTRR
jgi:hypothetical protein